MTIYGMDGARMAQYTQRVSDQQREIESLKADLEAADVREAELRGALANIKNELGVPVAGYPALVANAYEIAQAALRNPSPLADAAGVVLEAAMKIRGIPVEASDEDKQFWDAFSHLDWAAGKYRALRDAPPPKPREWTGKVSRVRLVREGVWRVEVLVDDDSIGGIWEGTPVTLIEERTGTGAR